MIDKSCKTDITKRILEGARPLIEEYLTGIHDIYIQDEYSFFIRAEKCFFRDNNYYNSSKLYSNAAYYYLDYALLDSGCINNAILKDCVLRYANRAIILDENNHYAYAIKGVALLHLCRFEEAIEVLKKSSSINTVISVLNNLGVALLKLNEKEQALIWFEKAIRCINCDELKPSILMNYYNSMMLNNVDFAYSDFEAELLSLEGVELFTVAILLYNAKMYGELIELYKSKLKMLYDIKPDLVRIIYSAFIQIGQELSAENFLSEMLEVYQERKIDALGEIDDDEDMAYVFEEYKQRIFEIASCNDEKNKEQLYYYDLEYNVLIEEYLFI